MRKTTIIRICILFIIIFYIRFIDFKDVYAYFIYKLSESYQETMGDIDFKVIEGEVVSIVLNNGNQINDSYIENENEVNREYIYSQRFEVNNTGSCDTLLRINIEPYWIDENGGTWLGDISFIKYSVYDLSGSISLENGKSQKFYYSNDDKYLYFKDLFSGRESIDLKVVFCVNDIEGDLREIYTGKAPRIKLNVEIVQASRDAYRSVWNCGEDVVEVLDWLCDF